MMLQGLGEGDEVAKGGTKKKKKKKGKKKGRCSTVEVGNGEADAGEEETEESERPGSSFSQTNEPEECKEEASKLSYEVEKEYWWAQADHIQGLTQEASVARAQKKEAEDIEVKNMRESFLLAEAMGVEGVEEANPYRQLAEEKPESCQTVQLAKFLEESIKKKESNLECPVCLEVTFILPLHFEDMIFGP